MGVAVVPLRATVLSTACVAELENVVARRVSEPVTAAPAWHQTPPVFGAGVAQLAPRSRTAGGRDKSVGLLLG